MWYCYIMLQCFPFIIIYVIFFVWKLNFVKYIVRWKKWLFMVCIINVQNECAVWDEPIKLTHDHEQKNYNPTYYQSLKPTRLLILSLPTYLLKPYNLHLLILNLTTYLPMINCLL
jgi:hypothetical protein